MKVAVTSGGLKMFKKTFFIFIVFISLSGCSLRFAREQIESGRICKKEICVGLSVDSVYEMIDIISKSDFKSTSIINKTPQNDPIYEITLTGRSSDGFFELQKLYILNSEQIIDDYSIEYHSTAESLDLELFESLFE